MTDNLTEILNGTPSTGNVAHQRARDPETKAFGTILAANTVCRGRAETRREYPGVLEPMPRDDA